MPRYPCPMPRREDRDCTIFGTSSKLRSSGQLGRGGARSDYGAGSKLIMKNRVVRFRFSTLAALLFASVAAAQLNPTVKVSSTPTGSIPESCTVGLASQERPRIEVSQIPEPAKRVANVAPPRSSLRGVLHDVQSAAVRGDRAAFREALARAKEMLATYPTGGERTTASDVIRVYDDLDRVWTYQDESRTGAFFDASTVPAEIMRGYPGYERAIADQLFIDSAGHRFYPAAETRDYLIRQAAQRLNKLGVSVPMRAARAPRVLPRTISHQAASKSVSREQTRRSVESRPATHVTSAEPRSSATRSAHAGHTTRHAATRVAEAKVKPAGPRRSETKTTATSHAVAESKPATSGTTSAALPQSSVPSNKTEPTETSHQAAAPKTPSIALPITGTSSSVPSNAAPTETAAATEASPASTSNATETAASAPITETMTSSAASTGTTSSSARAQQPQGKGVILPIILIVVGVGVLVVLFRASS